MGEETAEKLSIISRLSNISARYRKRKKTARSEWLEVKRELEAVCGRLSGEDELELRARLAEQEVSARVHGLYDIAPPGEMTLVKKRRR